MIHFVGLDVHRNMIRACIRDASGQIVSECNFDATRPAIEAFAKARLRPCDQLALEATFNTWAIARILRPYVDRLLVSNPIQTKAIAQAKIKTDKVDARVLSQLLRCDYLPEVWMPDEQTQRLRTLTGRRATLVSERTRIKNRIHSVLAQALIPLEPKDLFSDKGLAWLDRLDLGASERALVHSDRLLLTVVESELADLEKQLAGYAWEDQRTKLLMTLPGVNFAVAQTVIAALGDIARFRDGHHAASYLGLVPSTHQSADHCYHGPITRRGNGHARWMMIQAAQHVAAHPGPLGVFMRRLLKKKNRNVAVVAAARKLVVVAWHMLSANEPYRYAQPRPTQDKLAKLRVRVTGKKRVGGTKKGEPRSARYGTGQGIRSVPSIQTVYAQEDLPPTAVLKPAERRMLREQQVEAFVAEIQQPATLARTARTDKSSDAPSMAGGQERSGGRACNSEKPHARQTGHVRAQPTDVQTEPAVAGAM
jgi:transposase